MDTQVPDLVNNKTHTSFSNIRRNTRCPQWFEIHDFRLKLPGKSSRDPCLLLAPSVKVSVFNMLGDQKTERIGRLHKPIHTMRARKEWMQERQKEWLPLFVRQSVCRYTQYTSVRCTHGMSILQGWRHLSACAPCWRL